MRFLDALILPFFRRLPRDSSSDEEAAPGAFEPSTMACMAGVKSDGSEGAVVASFSTFALTRRSSASSSVYG